MMTVGDVREVIERITLVGGDMRIQEVATPHSVLPIQVRLQVKDRGGNPHSPQIFVMRTHMLFLIGLRDEAHLLSILQEFWTGMWMHESLETFILASADGSGSLPFNPHCNRSKRPSVGDFGLGGLCERVVVHLPRQHDCFGDDLSPRPQVPFSR